MAIVRYKLDPADPPTLRPETVKRLKAMRPEDIEDNALSDPDNPPLTNQELETVRVARFVQGVRKQRGLTQIAFARTYGMAVGRLRDWEQGRFKPDAMTMRYLATIAHEPEAVARAVHMLELPID